MRLLAENIRAGQIEQRRANHHRETTELARRAHPLTLRLHSSTAESPRLEWDLRMQCQVRVPHEAVHESRRPKSTLPTAAIVSYEQQRLGSTCSSRYTAWKVRMTTRLRSNAFFCYASSASFINAYVGELITEDMAIERDYTYLAILDHKSLLRSNDAHREQQSMNGCASHGKHRLRGRTTEAAR